MENITISETSLNKIEAMALILKEKQEKSIEKLFVVINQLKEIQPKDTSMRTDQANVLVAAIFFDEYVCSCNTIKRDSDEIINHIKKRLKKNIEYSCIKEILNL